MRGRGLPAPTACSARMRWKSEVSGCRRLRATNRRAERAVREELSARWRRASATPVRSGEKGLLEARRVQRGRTAPGRAPVQLPYLGRTLPGTSVERASRSAGRGARCAAPAHRPEEPVRSEGRGLARVTASNNLGFQQVANFSSSSFRRGLAAGGGLRAQAVDQFDEGRSPVR